MECQRIDSKIPERVASELTWSLVVVYDRICAFQIGNASSIEYGEPTVVDSSRLMQGSIYQGVVKSGSRRNEDKNSRLRYGGYVVELLPSEGKEGGFEYKKAIVDSIVILIRDILDAKESGLLHLCEFIEDCEKVKKVVLTHWNKLKGNLIPVKKVASLLQVCCSWSSFLR
ncbi:cofactor assembly of complex C subunit B, CCB2/CCB4 [Tanacetum coccineum]